MIIVKLYHYYRGECSSPRVIDAREDFHSTCKHRIKPLDWKRMVIAANVPLGGEGIWVAGEKDGNLYIYKLLEKRKEKVKPRDFSSNTYLPKSVRDNIDSFKRGAKLKGIVPMEATTIDDGVEYDSMNVNEEL